ncbi:hypothetical protein Tamer19_74660 [Cupriavidus sp. TA19]|uniref:glycosyltransferase family 2 protein n=1 Tax=Cupriavidus sp. TA19 TaxID=701108 RepID=UPI0027294003|nr:glycosyltransferase [Cupriavidus sp. TA19]GLC98057.1 hypothetical protein Tamer19_74660 [Cupriavidus sp. TA19]
MKADDKKLPAVSVIIPCYNQGGYLQDALDSCEAAYDGELEIIVVDDGSTDARTISAFDAVRTRRARLRILRKENGGLSSARNVGIAAARGDFIQLLDADDLLAPGKICAQLDHFAVTPLLDVSITNFLLCDEWRMTFSAPESQISTSLFQLEDFLYKWERGLSIPIHCGLFRKTMLSSSSFDESMRAKEDWVFWCSLKVRGAKLAYLPMRGAIYRQHSASMRRSYLRMADSWLRAASKIHEFLPINSHPAFLDSAVSWHAEFYQQQKVYQQEVRESRAINQTGHSVIATAAEAEFVDPDALIADLKVLDDATIAPLISIVVPIYNHYRFLGMCLGSIAKQGDVSLEVICVDDASSDPRVGLLLDRLTGWSDRFKVIRRSVNRGISDNQNEAVQLARGKYIAFLDCDDELADGALSKLAAEIQQAQAVDYFFTDRWDVDEDGKILRHAVYGGYQSIRPAPNRDISSDLLDGMVASHLKVIKRDTYLRVGGTGCEFSGIQDWELALKLAESGTLRYVSAPLYRHRIHAGSVTRSDSVRQMRNTNILRRSYQKKWLSPGLEGNSASGRVCHFQQDGQALHTDQLKQAWRDGCSCVFELGEDYSPAAVGFLREFNSYFDRIIWKNPNSWAALMGYTWSDILVDGRDADSSAARGRVAESAPVATMQRLPSTADS